ncbi:glutaredoxin family protein [Agarivorans sp. MS3-6]|uniref:glutaredoxin family protein n=1 Tax=Agarivorans sp. TSD2052 TaxID=2937286 RepID=UPI00200CF6BF|nr:glutaredoxin [Agarivorans sp. TSD2052]UPW20264.1 glutaredoxin [Agarivorans sp. TSD2052]
MKVIRWILGRIILLLNAVFSPKSVIRSSEDQAAIDQKLQGLDLYQLAACPFCVKVRRAMKRNGINIGLRDINAQPKYLEELVTGGGSRKVPCLRITQGDQVEWLYESNDIIRYLEQKVA